VNVEKLSLAMKATYRYFSTPDGSFLDEHGRILHYSVDRFINDICYGDCCFICGARSGSKRFSNEHIIPKWILRRYGLFNRHITLPSLSGFTYGRYVIPCCEECNGLLGRVIEDPVSRAIAGGFSAVIEHINNYGPWLFFLWQSLIYLKTHLKDRSLLIHRDHRKGTHTIGEMYEWRRLYHIHCIARSIYTNAQISPSVLGSFVVLPAKFAKHLDRFDYVDLYQAWSTMIRVEDMCFISVLNDCGAALSFHKDRLSKWGRGPLSPLQYREIFVRMSYVNMKLKNRPTFKYKVRSGDPYQLEAVHERTAVLSNGTEEEFGQVLFACTNEILTDIQNENIEEIKELVKRGRYTFLLDERGIFIDNSMDPMNSP